MWWILSFALYILYYSIHIPWHLFIESSFTLTQTPNMLSFSFWQLKLKPCELHSVHIFPHFYKSFTCSSCRCTHTHTCQVQLAINCSRTVHNDFTCQVWSCCEKLHTAECNGHREFQVSADKWPRLAVDQQTRGLSDLSLHQQTLLQPLGLSAGSCSLSVFSLIPYSYSVSLFLLLLIACNLKTEVKDALSA